MKEAFLYTSILRAASRAQEYKALTAEYGELNAVNEQRESENSAVVAGDCRCGELC